MRFGFMDLQNLVARQDRQELVWLHYLRTHQFSEAHEVLKGLGTLPSRPLPQIKVPLKRQLFFSTVIVNVRHT